MLQPILETIKDRFERLQIKDDSYAAGTIVTADTGFANEDNRQYLHENTIDGYIPDNQFRSRDPKFDAQKQKHPRPSRDKPDVIQIIPASECNFDPTTLTCGCPAGKTLRVKSQGEDKRGNLKVFFEGRLSQCRACELKVRCMKTPSSANHRKGHGRPISFIVSKNRKPNDTDWMKRRVDRDQDKQIDSHRMSVAEPVFDTTSPSTKDLTVLA